MERGWRRYLHSLICNRQKFLVWIHLILGAEMTKGSNPTRHPSKKNNRFWLRAFSFSCRVLLGNPLWKIRSCPWSKPFSKGSRWPANLFSGTSPRTSGALIRDLCRNANFCYTYFQWKIWLAKAIWRMEPNWRSSKPFSGISVFLIC